MLILKYMEFSNILSYGSNNRIEFTNSKVTQILGNNGAGKSSLATILEEVTYNKNSKGIKKADLFNWRSESKEYHIKLCFNKDGNEYIIDKLVKSTTKVSLTENGNDISGHTATQTYSIIQEIIGCDFPTFSKLIYQSVDSSLDFLTSTDAKRKEFLVGLTDQTQYKESENIVKDVAKEIKTRITSLEQNSATVSRIVKHTLEVLNSEVPELPEEPVDNTSDIQEEISELNSRVQTANALAERSKAISLKRKRLDDLVQAAEKELLSLSDIVDIVSDHSKELSDKSAKLQELTFRSNNIKAQYNKLKSEVEKTECPTCHQPLDVTHVAKALESIKNEYNPIYQERVALEAEVADLKEEQSKFTKVSTAKAKYEKAIKDLEAFEKEEVDIPEAEDISDFIKRIKDLNSELASTTSALKLYRAKEVEYHKLSATKQSAEDQLKVQEAELNSLKAELAELQPKLARLEIIAKTLKEIVAYKLEYSIKAFESIINDYLSVITSGKFALAFELDNTKLQVVIYNNGIKTSMTSCSTGQKERIKLATLLAIRKLMTNISKVNINLLFLDEVVSFLDPSGMDTLIELLLEEDQLNTFVVSHGYSHPLADSVSVIMDDKDISHLEN